jgi:L-ascorbate metabolism protein UlaG (beta-lactamase superfamily)
MKITMLGHSTLLIEIDGKNIITDPWLTDPLYMGQLWHRGSFKPKKLPRLDLILVSHGHEDHFDPKTLSKFSKNIPIVIFKPYEKSARKLGFKKIHPMQVGDRFVLDSVEIKTLPGKHVGGTATYLISGKEGTIFFGGDSEYSIPLTNALIDCHPDACLVPISGGAIGFKKFHMNPKEAARLLKKSRTAVAIPIHYHFKLKLPFLTRFLLKENCLEEFQKEMTDACPDTDVMILDYNETWER